VKPLAVYTVETLVNGKSTIAKFPEKPNRAKETILQVHLATLFAGAVHVDSLGLCGPARAQILLHPLRCRKSLRNQLRRRQRLRERRQPVLHILVGHSW